MSSSKPSKRADPPKETKAGPVFTRRAWTGSGSVEVACFEKTIEGDNGPYQVFNVVAKRTWKDDEGYQSGNSFRPEDLLILAMFLQQAASFIVDEQSRK